MGLDMRPMGRPRRGYEKRFSEVFKMLSENKAPALTILDKLLGKKPLTREALLKEWFDNQVQSYETIRAPRVGRDREADEWIRQKYAEAKRPVSENEFIKKYQGFYVISLAREMDGVPVYISLHQDENVFRGQFLSGCVELIGEELVNEAWKTKLADATLDYGYRLMQAADNIAAKHNLEFLKEQRQPPEVPEDSMESKLHIVYSLAKWLIYYGSNGHGYEADF